MDDNRQLRIFYIIFFSAALLIIIFFIAPFASSSGVIIAGLIAVPVLSYTLPWLMDLISTTFTALIYGFDHSDASHENQSYHDDMDKANRLVREGKWGKAVTAYRAIVQKAPEKPEPRFYLAHCYQKAGHLGLAASEYKKIVCLTDRLEPNHVFIFESERALEELVRLLKIDKQITLRV